MKNMTKFPTIRLNVFEFVLPLLLISTIIGCASTPEISERSKVKISKVSNQQVFYKPYEQIWRAAQLTLRYPLSVNNIDAGIIETDPIKLTEGFIAPGKETPISTGIQYKIVLTFVKGSSDSKDAVRVTVNKIIERKRDFFSDPESLVSDGLEEQIILYRMGRELAIAEAIKKAETSNK